VQRLVVRADRVKATPLRGVAAALPAPRSALVARSRGRAANAYYSPQICQARHAGRCCSAPSSSHPIVQFAATASMAALAGRRMRSATPTIDPATAPKDFAPARKMAGEKDDLGRVIPLAVVAANR